MGGHPTGPMSAFGTKRTFRSAAMEWSARFVAAPLLRHLAAAELSENRVRLFADSVDRINTYAVVGVVVFRDLEQHWPVCCREISRSRYPA